MNIITLHYSVCAKSVKKTSKFEELLTHEHIEIIEPPQKLVFTCTGAMEEVTGTADILLHLTGENKVEMTFKFNVVIHPTITQNFSLGRNFTGSEAKAAETNDHLYLTQTYH
jgi:hypothetical protein